MPLYRRQSDTIKTYHSAQKMLYGEITALSNQRGYCFAQNAYFAKLYDLTISTISRWISKLVKKGYLTLEIIYKEGTKAVDERRLYINDIPGSSAYTPMQSAQGSTAKQSRHPYAKKLRIIIQELIIQLIIKL